MSRNYDTEARSRTSKTTYTNATYSSIARYILWHRRAIGLFEEHDGQLVSENRYTTLQSGGNPGVIVVVFVFFPTNARAARSGR